MDPSVYGRSRVLRLLAVVVAGLTGCRAAGDDSGGALPPAETGESAGGGGLDSFAIDTSLGDSGLDGAPAHTVTMTHDGRWLMSPNGGPWTEMTGSLHVVEVLDGDTSEPLCDVTFALTAQESLASCADCDAAFDILYYVSDGDRAACVDPELPEDQATVTMAWSDARAKVLLDYGGSGDWVEWYDGVRVDDLVTFAWTATVGIDVDTGT